MTATAQTAATIKPAAKGQDDGTDSLFGLTLGALIIGLAVTLVGSLSAAPSWAEKVEGSSIALMAALAAMTAGGLLGFLFGMPGPDRRASAKVIAPPAPAGQAAEATAASKPAPANALLEIADWFTKIIVGAGLVGIKDLAAWIWHGGAAVGAAAGHKDVAASVFGSALLVYFALFGFMVAYVNTRTLIVRVFAFADLSIQNLLEKGVSDIAQKQVEIATKLDEQVDRSKKIRRDRVEADLLRALYEAPPQGFKSAVEIGEKARDDDDDLLTASSWLYLACAYGQQHKAAPDAKKEDVAAKAYDALEHALASDDSPSFRELVAMLLAGKIPGDDDLEELGKLDRFRRFVTT